MKIIRVSQSEDRQQWLDLRRGKISGSKAKGVKPLTRGTDRTPAGFWELLAENLAIAKDGEPEKDRGLRFENEALIKTAKQYKLKLDLDPGMWVSDFDADISVSPDSAEQGDKPTYAVEAKCLDSKNHLRGLVRDRTAKKTKEYNPLNSLKISSQCDFVDQAVQYFVVNEQLETLYFALYDDRMALDHLMLHVITIKREHVRELVEAQLEAQKDILKEVRKLIKELKNV